MRTIQIALPTTRNEVTQSLRDLVTKSRGALARGMFEAAERLAAASSKVAPKSLGDSVAK